MGQNFLIRLLPPVYTFTHSWPCVYNINNDYAVFMIDDAGDLDEERLNSTCAPGPTAGTSATKPSAAAVGCSARE